MGQRSGHGTADSARVAAAAVAAGRKALIASPDPGKSLSSHESRSWGPSGLVASSDAVFALARVQASPQYPPWRYPLAQRHFAVALHRSEECRQRQRN